MAVPPVKWFQPEEGLSTARDILTEVAQNQPALSFARRHVIRDTPSHISLNPSARVFVKIGR